MRIQKGQQIAGLDALRLRTALRRVGDGEFFAEGLAQGYGAPEVSCEQIADALLTAGLIRIEAHDQEGHRLFRTTIDGNALAMATAAPPVTRRTATRALDGLVERAKEVNRDPDLLYWVNEITVFGSYLDQSSTSVGDVDVVVAIERRCEGDEWIRRGKERVRLAVTNGRRFSTLVDRLCWPETEVWLKLKNRSRVLSIHPPDDAVLERVTPKLAYRREQEVASEAAHGIHLD